MDAAAEAIRDKDMTVHFPVRVNNIYTPFGRFETPEPVTPEPIPDDADVSEEPVNDEVDDTVDDGEAPAGVPA